jgi:hypothetical protein
MVPWFASGAVAHRTRCAGGGEVRKLIWGAIAVTTLMMSGCIRKGPYYIYGDYIEHSAEEQAEEIAEVSE